MTAPFSFNVHNWIVRETARHESVVRDWIAWIEERIRPDPHPQLIPSSLELQSTQFAKGPGKYTFKRQKRGETSERDCAAARTPSQAGFLAPQESAPRIHARNLVILSRLQNICVSSIKTKCFSCKSAKRKK
jgi:hypothetical protein